MKKAEIRAICEKHGFEIIRHPITDEAMYLCLETADDIEELDNIELDPNVVVTKEYGVYQDVYGTHLYKVYVNSEWLDLFGWVE